MRILSIFLLLFSQCLSTFSQENSLSTKLESSLHTLALPPEGIPLPNYTIQERMKARKVNGLSIAVIDKGKIVFTKSYGLGDASAPDSKVETTTLFQCASIGKMVTALAALHLVKEKKITLDEPINPRLINWKLPASNSLEEKVTLRHLLSHSSGLQDQYGFEGYKPQSELPGIIQMLDSKPPANTKEKLVIKNTPGTAEQYSGGGYLIVQKLIEDISGVDFASLVDSIIFRPLQMQHSSYAFYPDEGSFARGHHDDGRIDKKRKYMVYPEVAATGFWTTAADLALLVIEIQKEKNGISDLIADSSLVNQMLRPQINNTGLGTHLKGYNAVSAFWHSGNNAGYTGVLFGTSTDQGAIVLTNSDGGEWLTLEIIRSIADTYNWPVMQTQYIKSTTAQEYDVCVGDYQKGSTIVSITKNAKGLELQTTPGQPGLLLFQLKDSSFLIKEKPDHVRVYFKKDKNGQVASLQFQQNCGTGMGTLEKIR